MVQKISTFIQESRQEFKRVNWPSKKETTRYTLFVVVISIGLSIFLGVLDFAFLHVLENIIL